MSKKLPEHFEQTMREYKRQKRKEFRAIREAIKDLNLGCAYLPKEAYSKFQKARRLLEQAYEICKPWWRKA